MNLANIITQAVISGNKATQEQAQKTLMQLKESNIDSLFLELVALTQNERENELLRQSAATILSRCIILKDPTGKHYEWDRVSPQSKSQIKSGLINTLISPCAKAKRGACDAISRIALVEIPRGQWLDLLGTFIDNAKKPDNPHAITALTTIAFICQQFRYASVRLPEQLQQSMLALLLDLCMSNNIDIKRLAFRGVRDSICFMANVMSKRTVRDHIVRLILESMQHPQTTQVCLQTLSEYGKVYFNTLVDYINNIYDVTNAIIAKQDPNLSVMALDFWDTIAYEYTDRMTNQVKRMHNKDPGQNVIIIVHERLVPTVLTCLMNIDGGQNNVREAALKAMISIAEACGSVVFTTVINFVGNTIQEADYKIRQASPLAFSTLCQCKGQEDRKKVEDLLKRGMQSFINLLSDSNKVVVESAVTAFMKFNEFFPGVFLHNPNYLRYMESLLSCLGKGEKIAQQACLAICFLVDGLILPENANCQLAKQPFELLDKMTKYALVVKIPQIIFSCFSTATGILQSSTDVFLATNYIDYLIGKYGENIGSSEDMISIRSGILTGLHAAILVIRHKVPNDDQLMDNVFQFVCSNFDYYRQVSVDGLYVISALGTTYGKRFEKHLNKAWNYIVHAVNKTNEPALFKAAMICISDVSRSLVDRFISKFDEAIQICLSNLTKNIERNVKCQIFLTLADCVICSREKTMRYMTRIIDVIDLGFQGVVDLQNGSSEDFQYAELLKEAVIDFYECVNAIMNSKENISQEMKDHFPKLTRFVIMTTRREINPTVDYIKQTMFLLFDCLNAYAMNNPSLKKDYLNELNRPEIRDVLDILKKYRQQPGVEDLLDYAKKFIK